MTPWPRGCAGWLAALTSVVLLTTALSLPPGVRGAKVWLPLTPKERQASALKQLRDEMRPVAWWRFW